MGKKKKKAELKPWCWYCDREFEDEKVLIQHQKAKHFKCHICNKKLNTSGGLTIHLRQVHKDSIDKVPGALEGRDSLLIEIFGMEGVPEGDLMAHIAEVEGNLGTKRIRTDNQRDPAELQRQLDMFQIPKIATPSSYSGTASYNYAYGAPSVAYPSYGPPIPPPVGIPGAPPFLPPPPPGFHPPPFYGAPGFPVPPPPGFPHIPVPPVVPGVAPPSTTTATSQPAEAAPVVSAPAAPGNVPPSTAIASLPVPPVAPVHIPLSAPPVIPPSKPGEKPSAMIYSDNEVSVEEKRALFHKIKAK